MPAESRIPRKRRLAAVVLARTNYGEADLIVTFLTRELGLLSALARYGRRSIRRFGGGLLSPGTAAWYDFTIKPGSSLAFVENGEENSKAPRLPSEPAVHCLSAFALELVRGFEAYDNPAEDSFDLLVRHLGRLARYSENNGAGEEEDRGETQELARVSHLELTSSFEGSKKLDGLKALRLISLDFALKYLELAGFGPRLSGCLICGQSPQTAGAWRWSPMAGGLYCPNCAQGDDRRSRPVARALLARLCPKETRSSLPPLSEADLVEAELFFEKLAEHHLSYPLKSMKAARQIFRNELKLRA